MRTYKCGKGSRNYKDWTEESLSAALNDMKADVSICIVSKIYRVSRGILTNNLLEKHGKSPGGQPF